jgi:superfamily II DNA or RNA helicase
MLKEVKWSEDRSYRTGSKNEPMEFYLHGLNNSSSIDLLLGYFSSSAINVLSLGFAKFIHNGGILRLVVNNILSEQDKDAIKIGQDGETGLLDLQDIRKLKATLDDYGSHFFQCLSYLISKDRIQIKVVTPKGRKGIVHYKSGLFSDGEHVVGFKASCNFTAFGLLENLEELDAFLSWENSRSSKMIARQKNDFEDIFSGKSELVNYLNIEEVKIAIKSEFGSPDIDELLVQEGDLVQRKERTLDNKNLKKTIAKMNNELEQMMREPRFPYPSGPREYQKEAYDIWVKNNFQGVFAMATGTGKTITSLNCLLNEYHKSGDKKTYKAVIVVPTIALVEQWKHECAKFNFKNVICVSSKENWDNNLAFFNTASKLIDTSFIVIVTYASLTRGRFQAHFKQLPVSTLFIADEAHNLGSPSILKTLPDVHLKKRIGLSATPDRKYDVEGNNSINEFFNDAPPYIVSFSMKKALDLKWLCAYEYHPHVVHLNEQEQQEYAKISKQLMNYLDPKTGTYKKDDMVEKLLLKRKRIIHKAANKLGVFKQILKEEFHKRGNLKYTLVYVPEGLEPDYSQVDVDEEDEGDIRLINEYTRAVSETDDYVMVKQFTSRSSNRSNVLEDYELGNIHVLTSMKCLDEGVDVPRSELAIFCASTGNPRQFIQRRGRVLRLHDDKTHATIHDLVVIPNMDSGDTSYDMERNLVKTELMRVADFAGLAMNKTQTYTALKQVLEHYNLNMSDFYSKIN